MEENKEGTQQAAQEAYVRQLAELSARVLHMTEEQKQRNAAKIEELNKRVAALPPALRGLYAQKLRSLAPEAPAPQAAPVQQPPAADAAYEPEYADGYEYEEEDEDEVPARRRKKRKKHGCLIVMLGVFDAGGTGGSSRLVLAVRRGERLTRCGCHTKRHH